MHGTVLLLTREGWDRSEARSTEALKWEPLSQQPKGEGSHWPGRSLNGSNQGRDSCRVPTPGVCALLPSCRHQFFFALPFPCNLISFFNAHCRAVCKEQQQQKNMSPLLQANADPDGVAPRSSGPLFCFLMTNYHAMKCLCNPRGVAALLPERLEVCNPQKP